MRQGRTRKRALRGLALGFALSFLNLVGAFLTVLALGGFGAWTRWQFIGLFALIETATGIAFIIGPNIWRLPVAEANTSPRTQIRLAASTIFIPHWAAGAKALAGAAMLGAAMIATGAGPGTAGVPLLILLITAIVIALSVVVARLGVARPDLDVVEIVLKRPARKDYALPGLSLGASLIQFVINIGAYPAVKILRPSALYRPEMAPSPALLGWSALVAAALTGLAWWAWRGRIAWRAGREQQREAEEFA